MFVVSYSSLSQLTVNIPVTKENSLPVTKDAQEEISPITKYPPVLSMAFLIPRGGYLATIRGLRAPGRRPIKLTILAFVDNNRKSHTLSLLTLMVEVSQSASVCLLLRERQLSFASKDMCRVEPKFIFLIII